MLAIEILGREPLPRPNAKSMKGKYEMKIFQKLKKKKKNGASAFRTSSVSGGQKADAAALLLPDVWPQTN